MKRNAIAMIELIFAIVIIAISALSIPSMLNIAQNMSQRMMIDDDMVARIGGWATDKFQSRWDRNYDIRDSGPLWINAGGNLGCVRGIGAAIFRVNPDSQKFCDPQGRTPSAIPAAGDGNMTHGIEQLNGGLETLRIPIAAGVTYDINARYSVAYVNDNVAVVGNQANAVWRLGSSVTMNPIPLGAGTSHVKRVVINFTDAAANQANPMNTTITFFKSNIGN